MVARVGFLTLIKLSNLTVEGWNGVVVAVGNVLSLDVYSGVCVYGCFLG